MSEFWLVPIALLTSTVAGVFGMGGGVPLITLMPGLVPAAAILPLHAATQLASNGSRALFGWRHIDRSLLLPFAVGGVIGAAAGALVFSQLQLDWLPALIGVFILVVTWTPLPAVRGEGNLPLVLLGVYQTGIGMLVGATGPLGGAVLARRNPRRDWLVVNTAVYMSANHLLRVLAFAALGFGFSQYGLLLGGMIAGVMLGSWLGTRLRQFIPEVNFLLWFRLLVSLLALRMIALVLWP
ncbi:MAG: sulfite exporter TauE/SafE family protein [Halieaceae bacterium]|nr:sulfite exporter TauE/SafE family protein [Halieaceae bacterium]